MNRTISDFFTSPDHLRTIQYADHWPLLLIAAQIIYQCYNIAKLLYIDHWYKKYRRATCFSVYMSIDIIASRLFTASVIENNNNKTHVIQILFYKITLNCPICFKYFLKLISELVSNLFIIFNKKLDAVSVSFYFLNVITYVLSLLIIIIINYLFYNFHRCF